MYNVQWDTVVKIQNGIFVAGYIWYQIIWVNKSSLSNQKKVTIGNGVWYGTRLFEAYLITL